MAIFEIFTIILSTREHDNQKRVEEEKKLADEAKEKVSYMLHCTLVLYFTSVIFLSPPHCMHCYFRGGEGTVGMSEDLEYSLHLCGMILNLRLSQM